MHISKRWVFIMVGMVVGLMFSGCLTGPEIQRKVPDLYENSVKDRERIVVPTPQNQTTQLKETFQYAVDQVSEGRPSEGVVRSFPEMDQSLKRFLKDILRGREVSLEENQESQSFNLPYSQDHKRTAKVQVLSTSDQISPEAGESEVQEFASAGENDLLVAGRIERGMILSGSTPLSPEANQLLPEETGMVSIWTKWSVYDGKTGKSLRRFSVHDREQFSVSDLDDEISRLSRGKRYMNHLMKRVAWKVASRVIPHRFNPALPSGSEEVSSTDAEQLWESD